MCGRTRHPIRVGVSSEVAKTGLAQSLAQRFTRTGGPPVELRVAHVDDVFLGASKHEVSVTITNDASKEDDFIRRGYSRLSTKFAYDDFLILGPSSDRARIRGAPSAGEAFRRIAKRKWRFCSPAGFAPAHQREEAIWRAASIDPADAKWYVTCPGDALAALREADRRQAYTISDRSSVEALRHELHLRVLLEGDPLLHDDYAAILVEHQPRTAADRDAEWFVEWLSSYAARQAVENFRSADGGRFFPFEAPGRR